MDEENHINDKLKIVKFSLLPCGLKHTHFFIIHYYYSLLLLFIIIIIIIIIIMGFENRILRQVFGQTMRMGSAEGSTMKTLTVHIIHLILSG